MTPIKNFSLEQVEALIPFLEEVSAAICDLEEKARLKAESVHCVDGLGPKEQVEAALAQSQLEYLAHQIDFQLQKIAEKGGIPKGIDPVLVDFPGRHKGRGIYLCWKFGEKKIRYYHGLEEGFAGRKLLA